MDDPSSGYINTSTEDEGIFSTAGSSLRSQGGAGGVPATAAPPVAGKKGAGLQIAQELSDLVVYCQAVKFKVASLNEAAAKKLCRKHPTKLISYTRDHVVRTYPAAMRIDSSNFNPLQFWTFGVQMVALNYQTPDVAMAINSALFEQNGNCGYSLKPRVMWDPAHPLFRRFNPWSKDFPIQSGQNPVHLTLSIISGQHVCPSQPSNTSTYVELEILGIPSDCVKEKTKAVQRNSINPIWQQTFQFRINFIDLAFMRFGVIDNGNGKCLSQRVVPLNKLRAGYRHLRLRAPTNLPLDHSSLFIFSRLEEEEYVHVDDDHPNLMLKKMEQTDSPEGGSKVLPILKRQVFILKIYGLNYDDSPVFVNTAVGATVREVMFVDPSSRAWISTIIKSTGSGVGLERYQQKPAMTNQLLLGNTAPSGPFINTGQPQESGRSPTNWDKSLADATFLVCVHNVSKDQPYAILRAPISSTAQDIVVQVFLKARRMESPENFVLVEELIFEDPEFSVTMGTSASLAQKTTQQPTSSSPGATIRNVLRGRVSRDTSASVPTQFSTDKGALSRQKLQRRVLNPEENVCAMQAQWKVAGRFLLHSKEEVAKWEAEQTPKSVRKKALSTVKSLNFTRIPKLL